MRIGILCAGFIGWAGGVDFIRMLIGSLTSLDNSDLEIHVLIPDRGPILCAHTALRVTKHAVRSLLMRQIHSMPGGPNSAAVSEALGEGEDGGISFHHIDAGRITLSAVCRKLDIDIIVPVGESLGRNFPIPWVGYIYDFQHKYFPEYFRSRDRHNRERQFGNLVADARAVIVNSRAVLSDASKFLPNAAADIIALPFAASPLENWFADLVDTQQRYGISAPYFIISNQFWLHKRHNVAFAAFRELAQREAGVQLICTGQTEDHRDPSYFARLTKYINDNDLSDRVKVLGLIPKRDQIELLKNSIAVVQPTSFEGGPGGGSVYDAVSLGVPTIVSDIPVNREIESWVTTYFPLNDANALCRAMVAILRQPPIREEPRILLGQGRDRQRACGDVLLATLHNHVN